MARARRRTAVVERKWIGGFCPNINCLPSKNEIWSAKVADLFHHVAQFGAGSGAAAIDMEKPIRDLSESLPGASTAGYNGCLQRLSGMPHVQCVWLTERGRAEG
jgi:pyruvate/2-oxoglutarate dehydrogenase complex dihydrolipoamide dehydrogenase (E3) component